jgi:hypothetical protein
MIVQFNGKREMGVPACDQTLVVRPGEQFEVEDAAGRALLSKYPDVFEEVKPKRGKRGESDDEDAAAA